MLDFLNIMLLLSLDKYSENVGEVRGMGIKEVGKRQVIYLKVCRVLFENENSLYF